MKNNLKESHQVDLEKLEQQFEIIKGNTEKTLEELLLEAEELAILAQNLNLPELECKILTYLGKGYRLQ